MHTTLCHYTPKDCHLFGICWEDCVYVDQALPFGLHSAPKLFTTVADSVGWALRAAGISLHIHYLYDFFSSLHRLEQIRHFWDTSSTLWVPGCPSHSPATTATFLGIVVDTIRGKLRLSHRKIDDIKWKLQFWRTRRSHCHSKFESLVGHLLHARMVVQQGCTFLRHLYVILKGRSIANPMYIWTQRPGQTSAGGTVFYTTGMAWCSSSVQWPQPHTSTDDSGSFGCGGAHPKLLVPDSVASCLGKCGHCSEGVGANCGSSSTLGKELAASAHLLPLWQLSFWENGQPETPKHITCYVALIFISVLPVQVFSRARAGCFEHSSWRHFPQ